MSLDAVFEPRRVAVVGASDQPGKVGAVVWSNMARFEGEAIPVTPSADRIGETPAYARLADIDGVVDLAVLAIPAAAVPGVAAEAAAAGVRAIVVLAGGFAESGAEGAELQRRLAESAGTSRVVGPNCFGVQNSAIGLNASIAAGTDSVPGGIALITQSGAYGMAIHAMGADEHVRFGKVYASGNKVDIDDHEVVAFLRDDPATDIICLFAESVGDGRELAAAIASTTPSKPVIIAKTGQSEAGMRASLSHTGSLGSSEVIYRAAMRQAGAVVARSGLEMIDAARAMQGQPLPRGSRAGIITNSGGTGVELVDMLAEEGIDVPELSSQLQATIATRLPEFASPRNPVDMTPVWSRFAELYPWLIDVLARSGEVDMVIPILLQRSAMDPETVSTVSAAAERLRSDGIDVPIYVCWVSPRDARANAVVLQAAGVPCFEWPDRTARAAGHASRYASTRRSVVGLSSTIARAPALPPGPMGATAGAELLSAFGIETVTTTVAESHGEAMAAANGGPVALKTANPAIAHRTDRGGVHLGVKGIDDLARAYADVAALGGGVLVQPMVQGIEVAVGGLHDSTFGPVVMVGLGGTTVELFGDVAFALAPIDASQARHLLDSLRLAPLLRGFRGREGADLDALSSLVARLSELLAVHPEIVEIDLNPVMASLEGAVAVDWKITVAEPPSDLKGSS